MEREGQVRGWVGGVGERENAVVRYEAGGEADAEYDGTPRTLLIPSISLKVAGISVSWSWLWMLRLPP